MLNRMSRAATVALLLAASTAVRAEVTQAAADSFLVTFTTTVAAPKDKAFAAIAAVDRWWQSDHTYSGDAANLSMKAEAGACFCERAPVGSVRHGTVIAAWDNELLRIDGALGPLQRMAVTGILTFSLKPDGAGTAVTMTYRVNGVPGSALDKLAPAVDGMLGAQFKRLTTFMATGKATAS